MSQFDREDEFIGCVVLIVRSPRLSLIHRVSADRFRSQERDLEEQRADNHPISLEFKFIEESDDQKTFNFRNTCQVRPQVAV